MFAIFKNHLLKMLAFKAAEWKWEEEEWKWQEADSGGGLPGCETLSKFLSLSGAQFPHLQNGEEGKNSISLVWLS